MKRISDIAYVTRPTGAMLLDLYLPDEPSERALPLIIWIVGGGWTGCGYREWATTWPVNHGFAVASIQYRVSDVAVAPANVLDCKAAVRYLRKHSAEYNIDPDRVGAFGSSAGGHLAAMLGLTSGNDVFDEDPQGVDAASAEASSADVSSQVQAWCDFCGPADLMRCAKPDARAAFPVLYDVTAKYLGGPVEEKHELARLVSPMTYIKKSCPPGLIIHGKIDSVVPVEESIEFQSALTHVGADTTLIILPKGEHGWAEAETLQVVLSFFNRTLK